MPTAVVKMFINNEFIGVFRVLCDTGAQPNILVHNITKYHNFKTLPVNESIIGISEKPVRIRKKVTVSFLPWFEPNNGEKVSATFFILPKSIQWTPMSPDQDIPCSALPSDLVAPLADPYFWQNGYVGLIFGIELWAKIIEGKTRKLSSTLISQESSIGNILFGAIGGELDSNSILEKPKSVYTVSTKEMEQIFQRFWEFEDLKMCTNPNSEQELIEKMFKETHSRDSDGRFIIEIPIKPNLTEFGSSREIAR